MTKISARDSELLGKIVRASEGDADLLAWAVAAANCKGDATLEAVLAEITPNRSRGKSHQESLALISNALDADDVITDIQSAEGSSRRLDLRIHGVVFPGEVAVRDADLQILSYRDANGGNVYTPFRDDHTRVLHYSASLDAAIPRAEIIEVQKWGGSYQAKAAFRQGPRVYAAEALALTEILARRAAELAVLCAARAGSGPVSPA